MKHSDSLKSLGAALLKSQQEISHPPRIEKSRFGKIAGLTGTIDCVKGVFNKNGLVFTQSTSGHVREDGIQVAGVTTLLMHPESGEWMSETVEEAVIPNKANSVSQLMGIINTFHRRYQLYAFGGIHGDPDTDGDIPGTGGAGKSNPSPADEL